MLLDKLKKHLKETKWRGCFNVLLILDLTESFVAIIIYNDIFSRMLLALWRYYEEKSDFAFQYVTCQIEETSESNEAARNYTFPE